MSRRLLVAATVLKQAGWAPALVLLLHLLLSRGLNAYVLYPPIDIPMHYFGGVAVAFFLSRCFAAVPAEVIPGRARPVVEFVCVAGLTTTVAVAWEFAEFFTDTFLGTHAQLGLEDTLLDLALGMIGGVSYLIVAMRKEWRRRADRRG